MKSRNMLYLAMLGAAAVWGGSFVIMKDSLEKQDVFSFSAIYILVDQYFRFNKMLKKYFFYIQYIITCMSFGD